MTAPARRTRALLAAALSLVLLLGLALFVSLRPDSRTPDAGPAAPAPSTPLGQPGAPAPPQQPLTAAPAGVTWERLEGVAVPTSSTDGPTRVQGPVHAGFSRTPTGALLADAQISTRVLVNRRVEDLRAVARAQLVEGPGKASYLSLLDRLTSNDPPPTGYAQIAGFRYITYTPDLAVISRATRDSSGRLQVSTDTVRWVDGDWKLEKPASGLQQSQLVQNLEGYVPWSGIS